jgi:hypothetical protein
VLMILASDSWGVISGYSGWESTMTSPFKCLGKVENWTGPSKFHSFTVLSQPGPGTIGSNGFMVLLLRMSNPQMDQLTSWCQRLVEALYAFWVDSTKR